MYTMGHQFHIKKTAGEVKKWSRKYQEENWQANYKNPPAKADSRSLSG
jgi:hypothetical protein